MRAALNGKGDEDGVDDNEDDDGEAAGNAPARLRGQAAVGGLPAGARELL